MNSKQIKYELQNILSGKSSNSYDAVIKAIASYLGTSQKSSPLAKEKHQNKANETLYFIDTVFYINSEIFWNDENK